jgi:hypothetical protein
MELSYLQKREFVEQGFVHVPGVVPRVMVDAAVRAINSSLGEGMDPELMVKFRSQSYCPELQRTPVITELLTATPAWSLAESLVGEGKIRPTTAGQIALRFPTMANPAGPARPHLDGMHSPHNGVPEGTISNFTLLVGVLLSDLPNPNAGNFTVWPATHYPYQEFFREHTPQALLNGMPPIAMPQPHQIIGKAGDVVFVHYQIAHGITPNVSPHVRYAIFFRLNHIDHAERKFECMTDIWLDYEGLRELVAPAPPGDEPAAATRGPQY